MQQLRTLGLSLRLRRIGATVAISLTVLAAGIRSIQARTILFDPPDSYATFPSAINAAGWITGSYEDSHGGLYAFLRSPAATYATFEVEGATCGTYPYSINRTEVIVGVEEVKSGNTCIAHAFMRTPDGTLTTFDAPGAVMTAAASINDQGLVTGGYQDSSGLSHGFVRATDGTFTSFDVPGSISTGASSINRAGAIAGAYEDKSGLSNGFVRAPDGTIITFHVLNSTSIYVAGINDAGEVAGGYSIGQANYGFVRMGDGTISTFDTRRRSSYLSSNAIGNGGAVTGYYVSGTGVHGYVRNADGTIRTFDPKGTYGTIPEAINDKGAITGWADGNEDHYDYGFLRTP